jgi:Ca-activated chloride channel family protein
VQAFVDGRLTDQTVEVDIPEIDEQNPQIERMWAWHKVQGLLREADRTGSRRSVVDEVVRLGEAYSIATEYTSFIVLENDGEYRRWKIDRRNALRLQRDRSTHEALRQRLQDLRAQALSDLGPAPPEQRLASATPTARSSPVAPQPRTQPPPPPPPRQQRRRGFDLDFGGGAFDPFLAAAAVGFAGWMASRIRRQRGATGRGQRKS